MFQRFKFEKGTRIKTPDSKGQPLMPSADRVDAAALRFSPTIKAEAASEGGVVLGKQASPCQPPSASGNVEPERKLKKQRTPKKAEKFNAEDPGVPERLGDAPLRLIIVGTNPSGHAWRSGHYYSNPNNNMWRILLQTGIAPEGIRGAQDDHKMPETAGVGFVDVGCGFPGTQLCEIPSETLQGWAPGFYARLAAHMQRASVNFGCECGQCGAPALVAFAGKRQWMELLNCSKKGKARLSRIDLGLQSMRPEGWPLPPKTAVWVLPSTSGAAPMTTEERFGPWRHLARQIADEPWPRQLPDCPKISSGTQQS